MSGDFNQINYICVTDGDAVYYWKKFSVTSASVNSYTAREPGIVCVYTNNIVSFLTIYSKNFTCDADFVM